MFAGLRIRLLLVGVGVALFTVIVASFAVQRLTEREIRSSITRDVQRERNIQDELGLIAAYEGGWDRIADDVVRLSVTYDERIALADADGKMLADSERLRFDRDAPLPRQAFVVAPSSRALAPQPSPELISQIVVDIPDFAGCLRVGDPIEIGVPVTFDVAASLPGVDHSCLAGGLFGTAGEPTSWMDFDPSAVFADARLVSFVEPVQLFVGYRDITPALFPSAWSARFWLAIGLPVIAAAGAMFLTARRMLGPIDSLTVAAERMQHGDLTARADPRGRDELARLGTAFNEMAGSLQAADQARRTLTSDVAHELRSPLANLRGWLEGVQDGIVEPSPEVIGSLHEEAVSLQALVDDLQDLSLAESGHLPLHREPVDLADLLRRAVETQQAVAIGAGVELTTDLVGSVVVEADPRRCRQIVANLISNAIRHTPRSGSVTVTLRHGDGAAVITVADTGEGIAAEHLPRVFERFWRADASRARSTGGSGLGLAIVRQLVVAHSGTVSVVSTVGSGTTFTVSLPVYLSTNSTDSPT